METSKRIADKADELFRQYGIRSTGMDTIAQSLGMSKKTIYQYYENKGRLVAAFVEHEINTNTVKCHQLCQKTDDAIAELFMVMITIRGLFTRLNPAIIHELEKNHTDAYLLVKSYQSIFLAETIDRNLARGVNERLYRGDINRKLLAKIILENSMLTLDPAFLSGGPIEEWFGYLIGGMLSSKGFVTMEIYKNEFGILMLTGSQEQPFWNH